MIRKTLTRLALSLIVMLTLLAAIELVLAQTPPDEAALRSTASYTYPGPAPCNTTLQACINALSDGDRLYILPGDYTASLDLNKAVSLIGSNPLTPTILRARSGQRVLNITGATIDNSVVISGLQIVGGHVSGNDKYPANYGGGIIVTDAEFWALFDDDGCPDTCGGGIAISDGAWPTLNTLVISGNTATNGAGIYIDQSSQAKGPVVIAHSQIMSNTATDSGGGLYMAKGKVKVIQGTRIEDNTAENYGGGVYLGYPKVTYTQIAGTIDNNTAGSSGGGVYIDEGTFTLQHGYINGNSAVAADGGGIYLDNGSLTISATRFLSNSAGATGGGVYFTDKGDAGIVNSLFVQNRAGGVAAGLSLNGTATLRHLTVADPVSNPREAIVVNGGTVDVKDTIIVSHSIGIHRTAGTLTADYNLYFGNVISQSGTTQFGGHNVVGLDPRFVDPEPGIDKYQLQLFSPAVDAGTNAGVYTDLDGQPRASGNGFDIGAYELQADMVTIGPEVGGQLDYASSTGTTTTVTLPPGLVLTPTTMVFNNLVDTGTFTASLPPNVSLSGDVFELDAFVDNTQLQGVTFTLPVTIVVQHSDADMTGLLNGSLKLYRYEHPPYGNGWCMVGECRSNEAQGLDINNHTLTVRVLGFSRFGRMGVSAGLDIFLPMLAQNN